MRYFKPWVGCRYRTEGLDGIRVLLVGESHYQEDLQATKSFTIDVVRYFSREKRHTFFTKVQKVVLGLPAGSSISDRDRQDFWDRVAFYNAIQGLVGKGPRRAPTAAMWAAAGDPFLQAVRELQPHLLVVLGKRLASNLPLNEVGDGVRVCRVFHPSARGFSYSRWQPVVQEARAACRLRAGRVTP